MPYLKILDSKNAIYILETGCISRLECKWKRGFPCNLLQMKLRIANNIRLKGVFDFLMEMTILALM